MNNSAVIRPSAEGAEFIRRAGELGVCCWFASEARPITTNALSSWNSEALALVSHAADQCRATGQIATVRSNEGLHLLVAPDKNGAIISHLEETRCDGLSSDKLSAILRNYHGDIHRAAQDRLAIDGFNVQLSQSYEEINLTYRMARFFTSSDEPLLIARKIADELREVLSFGWLAIVFKSESDVLASLRGAALYSGRLPCDESVIQQYCECVTTTPPRVLLPSDNVLAAAAGSEVLVEHISHDHIAVGLLVAGNRLGADPDVNSNDLQLVEAAGRFLGLFHQNAFRFAAQRQQFLGTLHALSAAVDAKDPYTQGHSQRVALLAAQFAEKLGLDAENRETFRVAGLLHDIGKIGIAEAVLRKPAKLTDEEFNLIKQHPEIGHRMLRELPSLTSHLPGVLYHHERWDGRGYPHKLKGEAIPLIARVLAMADTFDAMSSNRSYRTAISRSQVLQEMRSSSGTQFDPSLVEIFIAMDFTEFDTRLAISMAGSTGNIACAA